ncbi:hypothetical protein [Azospirillum brasilense]|uniref:Uncharacterized protein n=1 Tax=Azospirillum brasilense TaxID=192 RepID=A0A6L3AR02_AZOBR|nr:hypothetical protein [Azospirillum brasilense]KAA0676734.1 hypothetical protein DS837_30355 [Azospirillum brasilense]
MPIDYEEFLQNRAREIVAAAGGDATRIELVHRSKPWTGTSDSELWLVADAHERRFLIIPDAATGPEVVTPDWCRLQARRLETSAEEIRHVAAAAEGQQDLPETEAWRHCIVVSGVRVGIASLVEQTERGHRSAAGWEPPDDDPLIWTDDPQRLITDAEQDPELLPHLLDSVRRHGREVAYDWGELGDASRMIVIVNGAHRPEPALLRILDRLNPIDEDFPAIPDERPDNVAFFNDQASDDPMVHWRPASCQECGDQIALGMERCACGACTLHRDAAGVTGLWQGAVAYAGLGAVEWRHDASPEEIGASIVIRMPQIDGFAARPEGPAVRQPEHAVVATRDTDGWRIAEGSYLGEPEHGWALCEGGREHD